MESLQALDMFKSLVSARAGLCFDNIREDILLKCVRQEMRKRKLGSPHELYGLIKSSEAEFMGFVNGLTINETFFFREPAYLRLFSEKLIDAIRSRKKKGEKIRILSAGCSTGEEPYSIAMSLMSRFGPDISALCEITGADIDADALRAAQKGLYWDMSFRGVERSVRDRFFEKVEEGLYRIKPRVGESVSFRRLNLLDIVGADMPPQDAIFYRNVSIYFSPDMQRTIFAGLVPALSDGGWLITASSEVMPHDNGFLELVKADGLYVFRKPGKGGGLPEAKSGQAGPAQDKKTMSFKAGKDILKGARIKPDGDSGRKASFPHAAKHLRKKQPEKERSAKNAGGFGEALGLYHKKDYKGSLDILESAGLADAKSLVLRGCIYMNLGMLDEAVGSCEAALKLDGLSKEAYLVLGSAYKHKGDPGQSQRMFRKALYIQPKCWIAHYYMAELCFGMNDAKRAGKHFRRALEIFETPRSPEGDGGDMGLFDISFQKEHMAHLCRKRLSSLGDG